jgi:hypothetical protein
MSGSLVCLVGSEVVLVLNTNANQNTDYANRKDSNNDTSTPQAKDLFACRNFAYDVIADVHLKIP